MHTSPALTWTCLGRNYSGHNEGTHQRWREQLSPPRQEQQVQELDRRSRVNKRECFYRVHGVLEPKPGGPARFTGELGSAEPALKQLTGLAESRGCERQRKDKCELNVRDLHVCAQPACRRCLELSIPCL